LYVGHAHVLDGKAYLVPLDGELNNKDTLIAMEWLMERLRSCTARQKLLIFDVARADSARGVERPSPGPLDPVIAKALAEPPTGVQIWSSCSEKEQSYEYRYASYLGYETEGGLFLNNIFHAFLKSGTGIPKPEEPLPVDDLAAK